MPRGSNAKREREYEELKEKFEESGRYKGRQEEVAARIVNKQRAEYGETKGAKAKERKGKLPDKNLPIPDYHKLTVKEITGKLDSLSDQQIRKIKSYEEAHKNRKTLMEQINRKLDH